MSEIRGTDGKNVICHGWGPKSERIPHTEGRASCITKPFEACVGCVHEVFTIRLQPGIGNQVVLCPRWTQERDWQEGLLPRIYLPMRRELCLTQKPFDYCNECPNSNPANLPRAEDGWMKDELRNRAARRKVLYEQKGRFEEDDDDPIREVI